MGNPWEQYQNEDSQGKMPWEKYTEPKKAPDIFSRIGSDIEERSIAIDEAQRLADEGEQTQFEAGLQKYGNIAGGVGDVTGEIIGSGISAITPEFIKDYLGNVGSQFSDTSFGKAVSKGAEMVGEGYEDLSKEYPRAMRNVEAVTNIGLLGAPIAKNAKNIGKQGAKTVSNLMTPKPADLSSEELRKIGGDLFKKAETMGGALTPEFTDNFIQEINSFLPKTVQDEIIKGAKPGGSVSSPLINELNQLRGMPLTLDNAKNLDEMLGEAAYSTMDNFGKLTKEGKDLIDMQMKLRSRIEKAGANELLNKDAFDTVKQAREYWAAQVRLRDIEKILERAETMDVPKTSIKRGFANLALRGDKMKGYTPKEVRAINKAARTGVVSDVLSTFGSRLMPIISGAVASTTMSPAIGAGVALGNAALSGAARAGATALQVRKANKVADLIRSRVQVAPTKDPLSRDVIKLLKEVGITTIPAGGVDAILEQLDNMKEEE